MDGGGSLVTIHPRYLSDTQARRCSARDADLASAAIRSPFRMTASPHAQRRYCARCHKAFAIVIPPDERDTERDRFCGVCAPLPDEPGRSLVASSM